MGNDEGSKRIDPNPTDAVPAGGDGEASSRPKTPAAQQAEGAMASGDPDALVESIETTREELSETLDAIADRVSPSKVKERTTARVKGAVKTHAEDAAATARGAAEQLKQSAGAAAEHFREQAGATAETVKASTADAVETVKDRMSSDDTATGYSTAVPPAPGTPAAVQPPAPLQPSTTGMQTHTIQTPGLNPEVKAAVAGAAVVALIWLLRRRR